MGRRKQITAALCAISLTGETNLEQLPLMNIGEYATSRDLSKLGTMEDLMALPRELTFYWVRPLEAKFRKFRKTDDPDGLWAVFAHHVEKVQDGRVEFKLRRDKDGEIDANHRHVDFSEDVVEEIATLSQEMESRDGDLLPFSPPDTLREVIFQARRRAEGGTPPAAPTESASE